jgi:hypothetical protein
MNLKLVDKFNDLLVYAFVTAGGRALTPHTSYLRAVTPHTSYLAAVTPHTSYLAAVTPHTSFLKDAQLSLTYRIPHKCQLVTYEHVRPCVILLNVSKILKWQLTRVGLDPKTAPLIPKP